jgi:hypothetical protein
MRLALLVEPVERLVALVRTRSAVRIGSKAPSAKALAANQSRASA